MSRLSRETSSKLEGPQAAARHHSSPKHLHTMRMPTPAHGTAHTCEAVSPPTAGQLHACHAHVDVAAHARRTRSAPAHSGLALKCLTPCLHVLAPTQDADMPLHTAKFRPSCCAMPLACTSPHSGRTACMAASTRQPDALWNAVTAQAAPIWHMVTRSTDEPIHVSLWPPALALALNMLWRHRRSLPQHSSHVAP